MLKKKIAYLFIALLGTLTIGITVAFAGDYGLGATGQAANLKDAAGGGSVPEIIGNVIGVGLSLISVLFFILMLYGGLLWMTARGKTEQTTKALDTIIAAVIGIVIILGAYALTQFVFDSLDGKTTSNTPANPSAVQNDVQDNIGQGNTAMCCYMKSGDQYHAEILDEQATAVECANMATLLGDNSESKFDKVFNWECVEEETEKQF
jgi:hypothetical protein